jgi:formylglycine-generating enzyme required for sulfatase activity
VRGLDGVLARALQSDPGRRYGNVIELSAELASSSAPRRSRARWWSLAALLVASAAAALLMRPAPAPKPAPFENSLGLRFMPAGTPGVLVCTTETRVRDFEAFWRATTATRVGVAVKFPVYFNHDGATQSWATQLASWREPGFPQTPDDPVVAISQMEASDFCAWLTQHERASGRLSAEERYRLPTDVEWSVAAGIKADAHDPSGAYPWHGSFPPPVDVGNFAGEELREDAAFAKLPILSGRRDEHRFTSPVGRYPANKHGLHDMGGNASEWVQGSTGIGATMRGSSWWDSRSDALDSGYRPALGKGVRSFVIGFRIVLEKQP